MTQHAQYDQLGIFYDLAYGSNTLGGPDLDLYLGLAKETGGTVLEMGSGTGRLCIPLAAAGVRVTAMELSHKMLQIADGYAENHLSAEQRENLTMVQGDMTTLQLDDTFGLIIFPYSSLLEVGSEGKVREAIENAFKMLRSPGIMVVDNFYYGPGGSSRPNAVIRPAKRKERKPHNLPDGRSVQFEETDWYDEHSGETQRWLYADIFDGRGIAVERLTFCISRTYVPPEHMQSMLEEVGFRKEKIALYGSFDGTTPLDAPCFSDTTSSAYQRARQVWICQK